MTSNKRSLVERDRHVTWHPYTQHGMGLDPLPIQSAQGAVLRLEDGRELIDGISSWWAILHGHGEPRLVQAASEQMRALDHVLFAGTTHEPAVRLAERLVEVTPKGLDRVFFSDNGSTAVEVALKMIVQNFAQNGQGQRRVFIALDGAYHGDTFGSMSVGDPDPFFEAYRPLLFDSVRIPPNGSALRAKLEELGDTAAGLIVEPLLQGAAGMRLHAAAFLREARNLCTQHGIPLIADEVMTGFGRTGALFACDRAGIAPDLMCLAKGLTGGVFPLSVTLANEALFEGFLSDEKSRMFLHGHTFTAHPVGCAIALESLDIVHERDVPAQLESIGKRISAGLETLRSHPGVTGMRQLGGLVAFEWEPLGDHAAGYFGQMGAAFSQACLDNGVLLRPLGNTIYALPPACTSMEQVDAIVAAILAGIEALTG